MTSQHNAQNGFIAYPQDTSGEPGKKAPYIDHGTARPDKSRYFSQQEHELEWEKLWQKVWVFAGLMQDVERVGDYFKYDLGRESFVVVRTAPDEIKAFYNTCPHRGNRLVYNDFGSTGENGCFKCSFHGWQYNLDGSLKQIRDEIIFREEVIAHRPGLTEVRCEVWNSLVFINMDKHAMPLLEYLDVIPEHLKVYPFEKLRVLRDLEICWEANWKTALEAFIEFYHADDVHPEVVPFSDTLETQYDLYNHGMSRMIIRNGFATYRLENRDEVSEGLQGLVAIYGGNPADYANVKGREWREKALCDTKRKWGKRNGYDFFDNLTDDQITDDWNYHVFPTITINVFADSMLLQNFRPHATDPEKCYYQAITLNLPLKDPDTPVFDINSFGPEAFGPKGWDGSVRPKRFRPTKREDYGHVLAQDADRVPQVQKGLRSRSYRGALLSESECRIRHYLAEIDRYLNR